MIEVRPPESIHQEQRPVENGDFHGRWHFSFDNYRDSGHVHFGPLRVFNDDTLDPGAVWPLHPHREIEVVTYCAGGEFLHEDEHGKGDVLRKGDVQHTTVGRGMWHSEINNRPDEPMRFIQMWIIPRKRGLEPALHIKRVDEADRTDRWLPLVSNEDDDALPVEQDDVRVLAARLTSGGSATHRFPAGRGGYLYVLEDGPVTLDGHELPALAAAQITDEEEIQVTGRSEAELLLVEVDPAWHP